MDRVKILGAGYRDWAKLLLHAAFYSTDRIGRRVDCDFVETPSELLKAVLDEKWDLIAFVGWSWHVPGAILAKQPCLCLHPSPLPLYRGGSPLQHQIIRGETESAITIFLMDEGLDSGPIYAQAPLSLDGTLADIFDRIARDGAPLLADVIRGIAESRHMAISQDDTKATVFKRRQPEESELHLDQLMRLSARELHNLIRAVAHPDYPNAFIRTADGGKLYITESRPEDPL